MTSSDLVPDRADLHERARASLRRRRLVLIGFVLAGALIVPAIGILAGGGELTGRTALILLVPVAVAGVVLLALLPVLRRQNRNPALLFGTDRPTRRAVQRALRTGHAPDERIDALARDTADRTVRMRWLVWFYAIVTALQAVLLVIRVADHDGAGGITLSALTTAAFGFCGVIHYVAVRRSRHYLAHPA